MPSRRGGCTLLFPPEVRAQDSDTDLLVCSDLWKPCQATRKIGGLSSCNPMANNKGCDQSLGNPCVFMRTCHHAVMLSGGWNKQLADEESFSNLRVMNSMLRRNRFASPNIKMFYGNGLNQIEKDLYSEELGNVYPSGIKFALRYHLRSLCEVRQCSNTLFIYLNSPARPDGASLLWDVSGNGELDETEVYTVKEMMRDLGNCKARRTVIIADQAFASEIIKALDKYSDNFKNTILFSPETEDNKNSLVSAFGGLASWQCISNLGPTWTGRDITNITLAGAPCDINMTEEPAACQNLSTLEMLEADRVIL
nr:uncharacterized protein LOC106678599 [Halyomorpha halys]